MNTKYNFVPDNITQLVEEACKRISLACLSIRKEGVYSGYFAEITDGSDIKEKFLAYDYGLNVSAENRQAFLVDELSELFGVKVPKEAISEPVESDEAGSDEQTPKKPRKRGKSA